MIFLEKLDTDTLELLKITKPIYRYLVEVLKGIETGQNSIDLVYENISAYSFTRSLVHFLKSSDPVLKYRFDSQRGKEWHTCSIVQQGGAALYRN